MAASRATTIQLVQPNPDPKPGRWVLPVVILAMMAGAWLFLSAAEDPVSSTTTTTSGAGATSTTSPGPTTTTTTLPTVIAEYYRQLGFRVTSSNELLMRAQEINSDFDNKDTSGFAYPAALAALETLAEDAQTFRNTMGFLEVPEADAPGIDPLHKEMVKESQTMVDQAGAMVAGLKSPDTGQARRAALAAFEAAVTNYQAKVDELLAFVPA